VVCSQPRAGELLRHQASLFAKPTVPFGPLPQVCSERREQASRPVAHAKANRSAAEREAALMPRLAPASPPRAAHLPAGDDARGSPSTALLFGWQRDQVERGKCPGEKMSWSGL